MNKITEYDYICVMLPSCMPECCAQWRFDGFCANTGGDCKFREPASKADPTITDGYTTWSKRCSTCGGFTMQVVRPGRVQCAVCG